MPASPDDTLAHLPSPPDAEAALDGTLAGDPPPDATLAGDNRGDDANGPPQVSAIDRTFVESNSTLAEGPRKRRHLESPTIGEATESDATLAGGLDGDGSEFRDHPRADDPGDDRTLAGDVPPTADDRTLMGDDPRPSLGDESDRTIVGDDPPADDRTMVGDEPPARTGVADDRTLMEHDGPASPSDATEAADGRGAAAGGAAPQPGDARSYDLLEDFARGGMGKIWRALDRRIRREVAYKELLPNALRSPVVVERFLKEAQITGQLEHPGVVPIYDLGWQENGTPYYSMKLVRGSTYKKAIEAYHLLPRESRERRLAFVKLLQQFVAICNTLGYSHERGVLHRDLKPLNIMVGDFGETLVLDWGLARLMSADDADEMANMIAEMRGAEADEGTLAGDGAGPGGGGDATIVDAPAAPPGRGPNHGATHAGATHSGATHGGHTHAGGTQGATHAGTRRPTVVTDYSSAGSQTVMGSVMGTPAYMPPEQAQGRLDQLDARSDNYALGAILYEILTNRGPIPKDKLPAMLKQVVEGAIIPPRKIDPTVPRALEAVCMKAMAKEKGDRYASALDIAREIEAYLADEPVSAYREPWFDRLRRWMRRHRTLVTTGGAVAALLVVGVVGWNIVESNRIGGIAREARLRIDAARVAKDSRDFPVADRALREAAGLVAAEPTLEGLRSEIRGDIDEVAGLVAAAEKERLADLQRAAQKAGADAELAVRLRNDLDAARTTLTDAVATLRPEPRLDATRLALQKQLAEVDAAIARRQARADALARFERFTSAVDQARFYGSLFTAGSAEEHNRLARETALAALREYGLDDPDAKLVPPADLSPDQATKVRDDAFELFLILAEAETLLTAFDDVARKAGAQKSLDWIGRAKALGIVSKVLPLREATAWELLDQPDERNQALAVMERIDATTALDHFLMGQEHRNAGNLEDALVEYQLALQIDPQYFWALQNVGLCHLRLKRPEAAVAAYTAAIASRPEQPICYLTRAIALADIGQTRAALADLKKAEDLKADPYDLALNRGGVHFAARDYPAAIAEFDRAAALRPERAEPGRNLAEALRQQADVVRQNDSLDAARPLFDRALREIAAALERTPNDALLYSIRGDIHVRLGFDEEAAADFSQSARLERSAEKRARAYKEVGLVHHRAGRFDKARDAYRQSLAANPKDSDVHRVLGETLIQLGQNDEATKAFDEYFKDGKPVGDAYRARGLLRASLGKYRDAMNDYTRSLEIESSPNILTRRGWAYLLQANRLALDDFTDAIRINPENPDSYNGRGYARVMLGDWQGAIGDAEEAVRRARALGEKAGDHWQFAYNASTIFAQAVDRAAKDPKLKDEDREKLASGLTTRALQLIAEAVTVAGPQTPVLVQTIQADTALDPIRNRPEFKNAFAKPAPQP